MNINPEMKKGAIIMSDPGFPENDLKKIAIAIVNRINNEPPIISYFHATISAMIRINAGMLCTIKPRICFPKGSSPPKTSKANIIMNRIAIITRIRGNQYNTLRAMICSIKDQYVKEKIIKFKNYYLIFIPPFTFTSALQSLTVCTFVS
jgi:hypothetical protein